MLIQSGTIGDEEGPVVTRINDFTHDHDVRCEYLSSKSCILVSSYILGRSISVGVLTIILIEYHYWNQFKVKRVDERCMYHRAYSLVFTDELVVPAFDFHSKSSREFFSV